MESWKRTLAELSRLSRRAEPVMKGGGKVAMAGTRAMWIGGLLVATSLASAGCGSAVSGPSSSLPTGVMPAARACRQVIGTAKRGFFIRVERVHLVLTTYSKGEPVESQGDISSGMPPRTLVWVVEVHAKAINWDHGGPPGYQPPKRPDTDYSVVMNARTGLVTDQGECRCWPLPLSKVGTVVSLPPSC
jgi:hypothetical protein